MKLQIGLIINRITGEDTPLFKEVTEDEYREAQEHMIERATANFYDIVIEEFERRMKKRIEELNDGTKK